MGNTVFHFPETVDELLELADRVKKKTIIASGTELIPNLNLRIIQNEEE